MNKNYSLLILGAVLFSLASCKKYPDGPSLTLRTAKARLANDWYRYEYKVGSDDVSSALSKDAYLRISKEGTFEQYDGSNLQYKGKWEFDSESENIIMTNDGQSVSTVWRIVKLTNDEFNYDFTYNNQVHAVKCKEK